MIRPFVLVLLLAMGGCAGEQVQQPGGAPDNKAVDAPSPDALTPPPRMLKQGTGFFIDPDGELLTVEHVVDGCARVAVIPSDRPPQLAEVQATDKRSDVALLHVRGRNFPFLHLAAMPPAGNATLQIISIPEGGDTGLHARQMRELNDVAANYGRAPMPSQILMLEGGSQHGESGSPILADGEAVGLLRGFMPVRPLVQTAYGMTQTELSIGPGLEPVRELLEGHELAPGRPASLPSAAVAIIFCR